MTIPQLNSSKLHQKSLNLEEYNLTFTFIFLGGRFARPYSRTANLTQSLNARKKIGDDEINDEISDPSLAMLPLFARQPEIKANQAL